MVRWIIFLGVFITTHAVAQRKPHFYDSLPGVSLRGLSVTPQGNAWVSGSKGTVGFYNQTTNQLTWKTVKGFEKFDFRDVHAWNDSTAVIMAIASPATILKTTDAGTTWKTVFEDTAAAMFLDAMHFFNTTHGIVVGDPIQGKFYIATTADGGNSWQPLALEKRPTALPGEACFASSGTNIQLLNTQNEFALVTGGLVSRFWYKNRFYPLPLQSGKETTGANGLVQTKPNEWLIVGGDFMNPNNTDSTAVTVKLYQHDALVVQTVQTYTGYRSGAAVGNGQLATTGFNALYINQMNQLITGFHAVAYLAPNTWIACGSKGKVVVLKTN